ncbi:MAG: ABC transporter substrate-binding protein [Thiotrichales bacterium]
MAKSPRRTTLIQCRRLVFLCLLLSVGMAQAAQSALRVGVLNFGTVNWELDVLQHHKLDEREGVRLEVVPLASKSATHVAIQGGAVDLIVTDWLWVTRQRGEGLDYTFVPASGLTGAIVVRGDAGIDTLADLRGKRVGVAGGPVDKSWLLVRAYSRKALGEDVAKFAAPSFGAPPLLNELALRGEIPAVLNYWHYNARLEAAGFRPLLAVDDVVRALGVERKLPLVGWVFRERWARENGDTLARFLRAANAAKRLLAESDAEWLRIKPLLKAENDATAHALREAYRASVIDCFGAAEVDASAVIFGILAEEGGAELVGKQTQIAPGTFWKDSGYPPCEG